MMPKAKKRYSAWLGLCLASLLVATPAFSQEPPSQERPPAPERHVRHAPMNRCGIERVCPPRHHRSAPVHHVNRPCPPDSPQCVARHPDRP